MKKQHKTNRMMSFRTRRKVTMAIVITFIVCSIVPMVAQPFLNASAYPEAQETVAVEESMPITLAYDDATPSEIPAN